VAEYSTSQFLQEIRSQFQQGVWPAGCARCRTEEESGVPSKRELDQQRWSAAYDAYRPEQGFITASLAFGNTCNLTCITCSPHASSRWQREHQELTGIDVVPNHFYKQDFVEDFYELASDIIHIDVAGGEPLLSGVREQQMLLWRYVESGQAANMTLHYVTNATMFPDPQWWDLWQHFREIDLQISIDGIEHRFEYLRYPAKWSEVLNNVQSYIQQEKLRPNLRLSVSHTVSAFNIRYLPEFVDWCLEIGLPMPWMGMVYEPRAMRPTLWPTLAKQDIVQHLRSSPRPEIQAWAELVHNTDDSVYYKDFLSRVYWHDGYRGTDFRTTFPELANFI
jgi:sulfatase maturation enzyme AslB (radical SAM superfamily)